MLMKQKEYQDRVHKLSKDEGIKLQTKSIDSLSSNKTEPELEHMMKPDNHTR
jgi:hypothetical protein